MPELTYIVAILIRKDILSIEEGRRLIQSSKEGTMNGNLGEMITKADKALHKPKTVDKISAKELLKDL